VLLEVMVVAWVASGYQVVGVGVASVYGLADILDGEMA
jgi:hypothetical protein